MSCTSLRWGILRFAQNDGKMTKKTVMGVLYVFEIGDSSGAEPDSPSQNDGEKQNGGKNRMAEYNRNDGENDEKKGVRS